MNKNIFLVLILQLFSFCISAATVQWTGTSGDNNWNTAGNWNTGSVPSSGDDIIFPIDANITFNITNGKDDYERLELSNNSNVTINLLGKDMEFKSDDIYSTSTASIILNGNLTINNSTNNYSKFKFRSVRIEKNHSYSSSAYVDFEQKEGTIHMNDETTMEIGTNSGGKDVKIKDIEINNRCLIFFTADVDVDIENLYFLGQSSIIECPDGREVEFDKAQDWDASSFGSRNRIRSNVAGIVAELKFKKNSTGDYNTYEDIEVTVDKDLTADSAYLLGCTNILGSAITMGATITAISDGDYNNDTVWSTGCVPTFLDSVIINNSYEIRIPSYYYAQAKSLNLNNNGKVYSQDVTGRLEIHGNLVTDDANPFSIGSANMTCALEVRPPGAANVNSTQDTIKVYGPFYHENVKAITSQNCHIIINPDVASRGDYFLENGEWKVIGAKVLSLTHQFDEAGNATFTPATGTVEVFSPAGTDAILDMDGSGHLYNLHINQANKFNITDIQSIIEIDNDAKFYNGIVTTTATKRLVFWDNATVSTVSNTSFVEGPVEKIGNDNFTFPVGSIVGSAFYYAPIGISGPALTTDAFIAKYNPMVHPDYYSIKSPDSLVYVSEYEYWDLDVSNGTPSTEVSLHWDIARSSDAFTFDAVRVAHYDGADWHSTGYGSINSSGSTGYVTSPMQSNFSPFTFGDIEGITPLPLYFISTNAIVKSKKADLVWELAEMDHLSHCIVEEYINEEWVLIETDIRDKFISEVELSANSSVFRIGAVINAGKIVYSENIIVTREVHFTPTFINSTDLKQITGLNPLAQSQIMIVSNAGHVLEQVDFKSSTYTLTTDQLSVGVYHVLIKNGLKSYSYHFNN